MQCGDRGGNWFSFPTIRSSTVNMFVFSVSKARCMRHCFGYIEMQPPQIGLQLVQSSLKSSFSSVCVLASSVVMFASKTARNQEATDIGRTV